MNTAQRYFGLSPEPGLDTIKIRLVEAIGGPMERAQVETRIYYDSFDWRLFRAGLRLLTRLPESGAPQLILANAEGEYLLDSGISAQLRFVEDLDPRMREILGGILESRILLPQVQVRVRSETFPVRDSDDQVVARVGFEKGMAVDPGSGRTVGLPGAICITPTPGYTRAARRLSRRLRKYNGCHAQRCDWLTKGLSALGRRPADYSDQATYSFAAKTSAGQAAREIHLRLFEILEANLIGTRMELDSEFLHDLRVSLRRIRSALSQLPGVFPPPELKRFRAGFALLGDLTGPARDLDVYLQHLPGYRASLPESQQADLDPLFEYLRAQQRIEHQRLTAHLDSEGFRKLCADWHAFLEHPELPRATAPKAYEAIVKLARRRINRLLDRVLVNGSRIKPSTSASVVHELRKECKLLRYLTEFFQHLFPQTGLALLIQTLKPLQETLGVFQDGEVQATTLETYKKRMAVDSRVSAPTLAAMDSLITALRQRQQEAREEFADRFGRLLALGQDRSFRKGLFTAGRGLKPVGIH